MAEKEYIDKQDAIKEIYRFDGYLDDDMIWRLHYAIRKIPAADVRPVVTCGECKHWFENGSDYCSCDRDALLRERDFFCAAGRLSLIHI